MPMQHPPREPNVLTAEPVVAMEKTTVRPGRTKYIPYTRSLLREFAADRRLDFDLFRHQPSLMGGRTTGRSARMPGEGMTAAACRSGWTMPRS